MPIGRYFAYVGGVLLVLLFAVTWNVTPPPAPDDEVPLGEKLNIRIESRRKGPEKVVIDTSLTRQSRPAALEQAAIPDPAPGRVAVAQVGHQPRGALWRSATP
ncbi:MAG: hypothetical protein ACLP8B_19920 [Xanthobacteraceae bacterium]|jgi:hypothetical protein